MIGSVNEKNADMFRNMVPVSVLNQLRLPDNFALADTEDEEPRGILIFFHSRSEKMLLIKWINVDEKYRRQSVADGLVKELKASLPKYQAESIRVQLIDNDDNVPLYDFFTAGNFKPEKAGGREYCLPFEKLHNNSALSSAGHGTKTIVSLDRVPIEEYRYFLIMSNLIENDAFGIDYPLYDDPADDEMFPRDNCFALLDDSGSVTGLYIMEHLEDNFYTPVLFADNSGKIAESLSLMRETYENLYSKCADGAMILRAFSDRSFKLVSYLLPNAEYSRVTVLKYKP